MTIRVACAPVTPSVCSAAREESRRRDTQCGGRWEGRAGLVRFRVSTRAQVLRQVQNRINQVSKPILYIKRGCPYCEAAINYLDEQGIEYETIDVYRDQERTAELEKLSGQTRTPTLKWNGDGGIHDQFDLTAQPVGGRHVTAHRDLAAVAVDGLRHLRSRGELARLDGDVLDGVLGGLEVPAQRLQVLQGRRSEHREGDRRRVRQ